MKLNANEQKKRRNSLLAFHYHPKIDIGCIIGTHLSHTDKIKLPSYKVNREDACYW
jgi:hypothetical protein